MSDELSIVRALQEVEMLKRDNTAYRLRLRALEDEVKSLKHELSSVSNGLRLM